MSLSKKLIRIAASAAFASALCIAGASALCNGTTTASALKMRTEPNAEASVIGVIYQDEKFAILENHESWYRIAYRGATGYVSAEYAEWAEDGKAKIGVGKIEGSCINIRTEPSVESSILSQLSDTTVSITGTKDGWYTVSVDGSTGYIHPDYITFSDSFVEEKEAEGGSTTSSKSSSSADKLLSYAAKFLGTRYVYGGSTPSGFDCSGFTSYVYRNALGVSLPRTSREQSRSFTKISSISSLKAGDLVFFGNGSVGHVGIYVGDGTFIHSPHTGSVVKYDSLYGSYGNRFMWGGRVL